MPGSILNKLTLLWLLSVCVGTGLRPARSGRGMNPTQMTEALEVAFGAETLRWWQSLDAFWSGKIPHVGADIGKRSG
jgi:hypothetical protein